MLLLLANAGLFFFCWILTDPDNYLWYTLSPEREQQVVEACSKIFWSKYYTWTLTLNLLTFAYLYFIRNRVAAISLGVLGFAVYLVSRFFFDPYQAENYVIIFDNQAVSPVFLTEPVKQGGHLAGEILLKKIGDKQYSRRYYAIKALGEIQYEPATEKLGQMLLDGQESDEIRGACYLALKSMKNELASRYLLLFSQLVLTNEKEREMMKRLERENAY